MIIKNGTLYHKPATKKGTNKRQISIFKNGTLYSRLGFKKIPVATGIVGFAQKVLSITATSVNKIVGVTRTTIEKVIGVN